MNRLDDVTIIIRTVGERTELLCKHLVLQQGCPEESVYIVRKAPFSEALKESFNIGLHNNKSWTFCVDADLLLRSGSVDMILKCFEDQTSNVCEIQGFILDKLFGGLRVGGVHVYRTSLLPDVIDSIPHEGVNIRPEASALKTMERKGFPYVIVPYVVGLHDFEQEYSDILRKTFVYSKKHIEHAGLFSKLWSGNIADDKDYLYAIKGFSMGLSSTEKIFIDCSKYSFSEKVPDKPEIVINDWSLSRVDGVIASWEVDAYFKESIPVPFLGVRDTTGIKTLFKQIKVLYDNFGLFGMVMYLAGSGLRRIGIKIRSIVIH